MNISSCLWVTTPGATPADFPQYLQIFCNTWKFSASFCRFCPKLADFLQCHADFLQCHADFLQYLQIFCNTLQIFCNTLRTSATLCSFSAIPTDFLQYLQIFCNTLHGGLLADLGHACTLTLGVCVVSQIFFGLQKSIRDHIVHAVFFIVFIGMTFISCVCFLSSLGYHTWGNTCGFSSTLCRFSPIPADFLQHSADFLQYLQIFCNTHRIFCNNCRSSATLCRISTKPAPICSQERQSRVRLLF